MSDKSRIITGALIILIFSMIINYILSITSFEELHTGFLISRYEILLKDMKRKIETGINFGKPIDKFSGMGLIFDETKTKDFHIKEIYVTDNSGKINYSTDSSKIGNKSRLIKYHKTDDGDIVKVFNFKDKYILSASVYSNNIAHEGYIHFEFSKDIIKISNDELIQKNIVNFFIITFISSILLMIILYIIKENNSSLKIYNLKIYSSIVIILIISQTIYTGLNYKYFKTKYKTVAKENIEILGEIIKEDIENILTYGLPLERLNKLENLLESRNNNVNECKSILITDKSGRVLYSIQNTSERNRQKTVRGDIINLNSDVSGRSFFRINNYNKNVGVLMLDTNDIYINNKLFDVLMDIFTIVFVALIVGFELLMILTLFIQKDVNMESRKKLRVIRFSSFVFFFAELIPISYIPIFVKNLAENSSSSILNLPTETIMGLPISSYMLGISIFVPVAGFMSKRLPIKTIFFTCIGLLSAGAVISATSSSVLQLIIGRFISGLGYGGTIINGVNLVINYTNKSNRTEGFGNWSAGYAAASICAIPVGGVIASRLGFGVGMIISLVFIIIFGFFLYKFVKIDKENLDINYESKIKLKDLFVLFKNRSLALTLLLASIPMQISFIGIFQYFFPMYMNNMGVTQSNIGRILTIYGAISLATPIIARLADRVKNDKMFIVIGNVVIAATFILFLFFNNILFTIIAIFLIGLGGMLFDTVEESYLCSSKEAKEIGESKLIGIYTTYEKIASVVAPIAVSLLITAFSYIKSLLFIGIFMILGIIVFGILAKNLRKEEEHV